MDTKSVSLKTSCYLNLLATLPLKNSNAKAAYSHPAQFDMTVTMSVMSAFIN